MFLFIKILSAISAIENFTFKIENCRIIFEKLLKSDREKNSITKNIVKSIIFHKF